MRSLLVASADDARELAEAERSAASAVIVDIASSPDKAAARAAARRALRGGGASIRRARIFVRVHPIDGEEIEADLDGLVGCAPDGVVLPEASSGADIQRLGAKIAVREAECGAADGSVAILAEAAGSGQAIFKLATFAGASRRLVGLIWSSDGLSAALGCEPGAEPLRIARSMLLFAAAAAAVPAFARVDGLPADPVERRIACAAARRDGFKGIATRCAADVMAIQAAFAERL